MQLFFLLPCQKVSGVAGFLILFFRHNFFKLLRIYFGRSCRLVIGIDGILFEDDNSTRLL